MLAKVEFQYSFYFRTFFAEAAEKKYEDFVSRMLSADPA